jgi:hypothetical protein
VVLAVVTSPAISSKSGAGLPFLFSIVLLGISTWIRMSLHESPASSK